FALKGSLVSGPTHDLLAGTSRSVAARHHASPKAGDWLDDDGAPRASTSHYETIADMATITIIEWFLSIDQRLVPFMQIAASSAVALMGLVVSIVVGWLGYRNNFGWKPVVLVTERTVAERHDLIDSVSVTMRLEVLNRRKYPLRLEWMFLE